VLRSKNAGPFLITLDIIFRERKDYLAVAARKAISKNLVAERYGLSVEDIVAVEYIDGLNAVKATYKRRLPAGRPGDPDCYGMSQEGPMLDVTFSAAIFER
jgi:Domain of unknown function (DUF4387)